MAVEGLVLTKPAYITTISQQNQTVLRNVHIFLINTKALHGQAMALCRLCEKDRERQHKDYLEFHSIELERFMKPQQTQTEARGGPPDFKSLQMP